MTAAEIFAVCKPLLAPMLEKQFGRRDLCIVSTRVVIEVAAYFGIKLEPLPVQAVFYNAKYKEEYVIGKVPAEEVFQNGGWCVGVGFGEPDPLRFLGHLIAVGDGYFGDFAAWQAERPAKNLLIGEAIIGPYFGHTAWQMEESENGVTVEYRQISNMAFKRAPDWKDPRRRRAAVASLIRAVKARRKTA